MNIKDKFKSKTEMYLTLNVNRAIYNLESIIFNLMYYFLGYYFDNTLSINNFNSATPILDVAFDNQYRHKVWDKVFKNGPSKIF